MTGVFPPNSKPTFLRLDLAEYSRIFLPIKVDPVKLILEILWEIAKASPAVCPYPITML
jgi:hypothetical protein